MPNPKITITKPLIRHIQNARNIKGITAAELSLKLGRTTSYVSAMENQRISKIASGDLTNIFMILHDISEDQAIDKIEEILNMSPETANIDDQDILADERIVLNKNSEIKKYNPSIDISPDDEFKKLLSIMNSGFFAFFEKEPEEAERVLKRLISSMKFDLGFIVSIFSVPFAALQPLTHDERQQAYDDIASAFKKHYEIAQSKKKSEE